MKIFISVLAVFLMFGCGGDEKKSTHTSSTQEHEAHKVTKTTPVRTEAAAHEESTQAQTMVEETQAQTATMADEVATEADTMVQEANAMADEAKSEANAMVESTKSEANAMVAGAKSEASAMVAGAKSEASDTLSSAKSGKNIFSACSGCHGSDGSKKALGKSQMIKGWDAQKVIDALNGYKAGTYGGVMKGLMKGQVTKLSDTEIEAVAKYISTL
jgi:cytochrome c553